MRKVLAIVGCLLVVMMVLTGCGKKSIEGAWDVEGRGYIRILGKYDLLEEKPLHDNPGTWYYRVEFVEGSIVVHSYMRNVHGGKIEGPEYTDYSYDIISDDQIKIYYSGWGSDAWEIYNYDLDGDSLRIYANNNEQEAIFRRVD